MKTILYNRGILLMVLLFIASSISSQDLSWAEPMKQKLELIADSLTQNLKPWQVPKRTFRVERFGAKGDGKSMNTVAIQKAIDTCSERGGGVVLFSKGDYLTGTFQLKSGVMIQVDKGARILGSTDINDYPEKIEEFKSVMSEIYRFRQSLIYAEKAERIGIRGLGEIYFQGEKSHFSSPETVGPIKDRPLGIRMIECKQVVLQDIFLHNSAAWMQNYLACQDLIFDGIRVVNHANYNNDGLDPDGCTNVIIRNCYINAEDDAMCLKGASSLPSQNMLIENSTFVSTCNALKVGTDTQGDFRNIIVRNVTLGGVPEGEETIAGRQSSTGITLATVDGGHVHDVLIQNATINQARCPIFIRIGNRGRVIPGVEKPVPGTLKHIVIENVSGKRNFRQGSLISGIYNAPVEDIVIRNYQIKMEGGGGKELIHRTVPESEAGYPDAHKFLKDGLPSYGFFLRHAQGVTIQNASVATESRDERPELSNGGDVSNSVYNDISIH
jgi:polygalacturonase